MGFWSRKSPEERAESFDAQYDRSAKRAEGKRRAKKYPYNMDHLVEGDKDRRKREKK